MIIPSDCSMRFSTGSTGPHAKVSTVEKSASRHKIWTADRVEKLWKELDVQIETAMAELETNDSIDELFDDGTSPGQLPPQLADLKSRRTMMNEVLVMADSAFATGPNIAGLEERGIEFFSPLAEVPCEKNPALRDDPKVPVATEDLQRLPINPQAKKIRQVGVCVRRLRIPPYDNSLLVPWVHSACALQTHGVA